MLRSYPSPVFEVDREVLSVMGVVVISSADEVLRQRREVTFSCVVIPPLPTRQRTFCLCARPGSPS
jgi:hypothetical protein